MGKRIIQTIQREIVDVNTGELVKVDSQKTFTEKVSPDRFYMTFLDYTIPLQELNSIKARQLLDWMCNEAQYNTGIVLLPASIRQKVCENLVISNNQLTNLLKTLKDLNLITGEKGTFTINPEIFWKGDAISRKEILKNKLLKVSFELIDENNDE